jgi:cyd operon protein YbgT
MWYFSWILGVLLACSVGIINAMWVEMHLTREKSDE